MGMQKIILNKPEDKPVSLAGLSQFSKTDRVVASGYLAGETVWKCIGLNNSIFYVDSELKPFIKYCHLCESLVYLVDFNRDKTGKFGKNSCCKLCHRANSRASYRKKKGVKPRYVSKI